MSPRIKAGPRARRKTPVEYLGLRVFGSIVVQAYRANGRVFVARLGGGASLRRA